MRLKSTGEFSVMKMENDTKIEKELTCQFKTDMRNLTSFVFDKVNNVWAKKSIEELFLMELNIDEKFEMTFAFKNDMRNLAHFHQSMFESLKIGTLMGSFYPK